MKMGKRRASFAAAAAVIAATAFFSMFPSSPARAIDAGEVMDKMDAGQRAGFLAGAVDMASHLYAATGNQEKSRCVVDWFFREEGTLRQVHSFFESHKDKDAVALLAILIDRHCGK